MEGLFNVVIIFGAVVFCVNFSSAEENVSLVTKTSLTTAKTHDGLIPKPTSSVGETDVEPIEQSSSTPYDLFGVTGPQRRSKYYYGGTSNSRVLIFIYLF